MVAAPIIEELTAARLLGGFSGEDTPDDDLLRACVHCGMCLPTCPTYRLTGQEASSPRGRLWMMRAVADGRLDLGAPEFDEQMYQCLNCRACEAVCPSGVRYGPLVEASRAQLEQHRPRPVWQKLARAAGLAWPFADIRRLRTMVDLLRIYQKTGLAKVARKSGVLQALRMDQLESMLQPLREEPLIAGTERWGHENSEPAQLFNGCVMSTVFSNVNRATGRVLARNGYAVTVPATQQCCGALHVHSGMMADARRLAKRNIRAFEAAGDGPIVVTAAGCGAALKEYDFLLKDDPEFAARAKAFAERVVDVSELLARKPLTPPTHRVERTVTYQEPCHLAHAQRITEQPRELLAQVPGLELIEMKESSLCCGSAGIYNIIRKDMANELGDRKICHILETGASEVITANPGCAMQIRTSLHRRNATLPVMHIVEVLDEAYGGPSDD